MKKLLLLSALAFLCLNSSFAQCIVFQNPSFEGVQDTVPPPDWDSCIKAYTLTNEYAPLIAYAGSSYLGLGYSNSGGDSICDAVNQLLTVPLIANHTYTGTVALCSVHNQTGLSSGLVCQICGGHDSCSPVEALWTSPVIEDSMTPLSSYIPHWSLDSFTLYPHGNYTYIIIRVTAYNYTQITGGGGLIGVDTLTMCDVTTTGILAINTSTVSIYPNPATNIVTVNTGINISYTLTIFDLTGREIITKEMTGTGTIDVSQLSKGCYLAKVIQGGKSYCQKLVVQ